MKKSLISLALAFFTIAGIFTELPKIENDAESAIRAFQSLAGAIYKAGSPSLDDVDWHNHEFELKTYSEQLKLDYENVSKKLRQAECYQKQNLLISKIQ